MSVVLHPGNAFTLVRQIANHTDAATYYVQAVIRNAYTDAIIATLQLTDKGGQRFKKDWAVPGDSSGQGFYVSIVTSVYTDSGYTTKSENYGDEETTYLIQDRVFAGGGGGGIDAFTVREIMREEIAKIPQPEPVKIPEAPKYEMRWDELLKAIKAVPEADLGPILSAIRDTRTAINNIPVPSPTDLSPILSRLESDKGGHEEGREGLKQFIAGIEDTLIDAVSKAIPDTITQAVHEAIKSSVFNGTMQFSGKDIQPKAPVAEKPKEAPLDIKKISL